MTVRLDDDGGIILEGPCPIEDTDALLSLLVRHPNAPVIWTGCEFAHTAIVQLLLAARPVMRGPPGSPFLARWIGPDLGAPAVSSTRAIG